MAAADLGDPPPATAPSATWTGQRLTVAGHPSWKLSVSYGVGDEVAVNLEGGARWPSQTKLIAGSEERWLEGSTVVKMNLPALYGSVAVQRTDIDAGVYFHSAGGAITPEMPLRIRFSNGVEIVTTFPSGTTLGNPADAVMRYAKDKPLVFDGEKDHKGSHSIYYLDSFGSPEVVGSAKNLSDVDWLAVANSKTEKSSKTCAYVNGGSLPLELETQTITVYDRRTHAVVDTKTFGPSRECPTFAFNGRALARPYLDPIHAWFHSVDKAH